MEYEHHENQEPEIIAIEKEDDDEHENEDKVNYEVDDDVDENINSSNVQEQMNCIAFTQQPFSSIESMNSSDDDDVNMHSDGKCSDSSNTLTIISRSSDQNSDESHSMNSWQMFSLDEDDE